MSDNGSGISTKNFENLCLKHYTSKLEEFEDLLNVETFGFRGEALSSLCALSLLTVTTCEKGSNLGWKLEFDHSGKLTKQIQCSRPVRLFLLLYIITKPLLQTQLIVWQYHRLALL